MGPFFFAHRAMNLRTSFMINQSHSKQNARLTEFSRSLRTRISRGQAAVEFALISTVALMIMLVGVQYAMIGQAALAVSQGASAIARYAAVNESTVGASYSGNPTAAMQALLSSSLSTNGWGDLTVNIASYTGTTTTATATPGLGDHCLVSLSYKAKSKIALPNPFLGLVSFPTVLAASDSQMYE
jgi:Flp pilus assembly protein TadG